MYVCTPLSQLKPSHGHHPLVLEIGEFPFPLARKQSETIAHSNLPGKSCMEPGPHMHLPLRHACRHKSACFQTLWLPKAICYYAGEFCTYSNSPDPTLACKQLSTSKRMCVCVHVCMFIVYVCVYLHMCTWVCVYHVRMCVCMYVILRMCMHTCLYAVLAIYIDHTQLYKHVIEFLK